MSSYPKQNGFSLLELIVVFSLIAILFALAAARYQANIGSSQATVVNFQANAFLRSVENVHAMAAIQKSSVVDLGQGINVYLNKTGWPIATNIDGLPRQIKPTQEGCFSLWHGLFSDARNKNSSAPNNSAQDFEISLIDDYICRYQLVRKQEGSYFFDYDVITGKVLITSNET